jgi:hypothetical protein
MRIVGTGFCLPAADKSCPNLEYTPIESMDTYRLALNCPLPVSYISHKPALAPLLIA